jgi:S-adenosylmethionine:tRNA ribosyltransferase-isomerase
MSNEIFASQETAIEETMHITDFDYDLPANLIAQAPLAQRDASRMMVVHRDEQRWSNSSFKNFTSYLRPNDVVVVNNSRVIPARLIGHREETGGQVEIFLVREIEAGCGKRWSVPAPIEKRRARSFGDGRLMRNAGRTRRGTSSRAFSL